MEECFWWLAHLFKLKFLYSSGQPDNRMTLPKMEGALLYHLPIKIIPHRDAMGYSNIGNLLIETPFSGDASLWLNWQVKLTRKHIMTCLFVMLDRLKHKIQRRTTKLCHMTTNLFVHPREKDCDDIGTTVWWYTWIFVRGWKGFFSEDAVLVSGST